MGYIFTFQYGATAIDPSKNNNELVYSFTFQYGATAIRSSTIGSIISF
ncbi:hypothetical protein [Clostridium sp.]